MTAIPPSTVLPYESASDEEGEFTRDEVLVVGLRNVPFPPRCVKCNAPVDPHWRWTRTLYWQPKAIGCLAFGPGILIYAIVSMFVRKPTRVSVGLCPRHRRLRRIQQLVSIPFIIVGLIFVGVAISMISSGKYPFSMVPMEVMACGVVPTICGVIYLNAVSKLLVVKKIEGPLAWYSGAGIGFLRALKRVAE